MRSPPSIALAPAIVALAFLASCGQGDEPAPLPPGPVPEAPADATDFSRELNLLGNEPFWSVRIRAETLTFSALDQPDVEAANPGPEISNGEAVWLGDAQGQPLRVTLRAQVCQDTMAGLLYPFRAEVELDGQRLEGCAAYADAMPREGG